MIIGVSPCVHDQVPQRDVQQPPAGHQCGGVFPQRGVVSAAADRPQHPGQVTSAPAEGDHPGGRLL